MIARIVVTIGVNPLVIEKIKMQTYSMRNMIVMRTIAMKTLKTMPKPTSGVMLIMINTGL